MTQTLQVRRVPIPVMRRLSARAALFGRSREDEVRRILAAAAAEPLPDEDTTNRPQRRIGDLIIEEKAVNDAA